MAFEAVDGDLEPLQAGARKEMIQPRRITRRGCCYALLSRSDWTRSSRRLPSDSRHKQSRFAALSLYLSLRSIRRGASILALP